MMYRISFILFCLCFYSSSFAAWTYNAGVLSSSGATESSPDSLLAGIALVQSLDSTRAFTSNRFAKIDNVRIDVSNNSWVKFDDDVIFEFTGNTRLNPFNETSNGANNGGSSIFGYRMVLIINTNTWYVDVNSRSAGNGGNFISLRSPSGINPLVIQQTATRNDFPTFGSELTANRIDITGLTIRNNGSSRKIYFGRARNLVNARNVSFETTTGEYQTAQTTYNNAVFPTAQHSGDSFDNTSTFYDTEWGTEQTGTIQFSLNSIRRGNYYNYDPVFPTATWDGTYRNDAGAGMWSVDGRYAKVSYKNTEIFKAGTTFLSGVNVRWIGEAYNASPYAYTLANAGETLTHIVTTTGTGVAQKYLLSALIGREGGSLRASNKYRWDLKARKYDYKTASEHIFENKIFLPEGNNGPLIEEQQMIPVPHLTLTESQASAISGISFTPSGPTGGTVTITGARTVSELWQYYRAWISQTANFDSSDTWTYDGTTLNIGAWNLQVNGINAMLSSASNIENRLTTSASASVSAGGVINLAFSDANTNSSVTITTTSPFQVVKVFGSIANLNANTGVLGTYVSDANNRLIYRYNDTPGTLVYFKTELSASVPKGSMKSYELVSGYDNTLDLSLGGDFNYVNLQLNQIKGYGFNSSLHSLKATTQSGSLISITQADKEAIALLLKTKMEEAGGLLNRIFLLLQEILTRIISVKYDTQKIN